MAGRRAAVALIIFVAMLPLQWQELAHTPLGELRWFHLGALAMIVIARIPLAQVRQVIRSATPLVALLMLFTLLSTAMAVAHGGGAADPVQNMIYALVGLYAAATLVVVLEDERGRRFLTWVAPVSLVTFVLVFYRAAHAAGADPIAALNAARAGHPGPLLSGLFRVTFAGGVPNPAVPQFRHDIFGALLVAAYISALGRGRRLATLAAGSAAVVIGGLIMISLSRSVLLAALLALVGLTARTVLTKRLPVAVFSAGLVGLVLLIAAGPRVADLLYQRVFVDTGSYQVRLDSLAQFRPGELPTRLLVGGGPLATSTHNMVTDAALRGSLVAAVLALAIVLVIVQHVGRAWVRYLRGGSLADFAALGAGMLIIVRAFTAGGGYLHMSNWVALGVVLAQGCYATRSAGDARSEQIADEGVDGGATGADGGGGAARGGFGRHLQSGRVAVPNREL